MNECTNPCTEYDCPDRDEGIHCHHDHRDPETKRLQSNYEAEMLRREKAIRWLIENINDLQDLLIMYGRQK